MYSCRFTVPVLWDKKLHTIVNNESSEIIRIFNTAFNEFITPGLAALDFYPEALRPEIDSLNEWIYPNINSMIHFRPFPHTWSDHPVSSQTEFTDQGLQQLKELTRKPSTRSLKRSTRSKRS